MFCPTQIGTAPSKQLFLQVFLHMPKHITIKCIDKCWTGQLQADFVRGHACLTRRAVRTKMQRCKPQQARLQVPRAIVEFPPTNTSFTNDLSRAATLNPSANSYHFHHNHVFPGASATSRMETNALTAPRRPFASQLSTRRLHLGLQQLHLLLDPQGSTSAKRCPHEPSSTA